MTKAFLVGAGLLSLGLLLAGCNQTTGQGPAVTADASAPVATPVAASAAAPAITSPAAELPPIYEPLVDMNRVNPAKYRRDLAECRLQAAPQEAVVRQARQQQTAGTAVQVAGAVASYIPVSGFSQARTLFHATNAAQQVGGATAESAAITADQASADYALVVDACLTHRRYRLLRAG